MVPDGKRCRTGRNANPLFGSRKSNKCRGQVFRRNKILPAYRNQCNHRERIGQHLVEGMLYNFKLAVTEVCKIISIGFQQDAIGQN